MHGDPDVKSELISFAKEKLICRTVNSNYWLKKHEALAVLSVRLMLDFEPLRVALQRDETDSEANQVARHMRIAYSVPSHREYMRSGSPSEPILAEAAAQLMKHIEDVPKRLAKFVNRGLIEKGQAGELVARLLLTLAYDSAIKANPKPDVPYSQGCALSEFLTKLVGETNYLQLADSMPDNLEGTKNFKDTFKNSRVRFTHFGRAANAKALSPRFVWASFLRCMAVQCHTTQASIDIIIPVLLDETKPVEASNMTAILISVKDRSRAGNATSLNFFASELGFLPVNLSPRPYISFLMQLNIEESPEFRCGPLESPGRKHHIELHPRFTINVEGCRPELYPVIAEESQASYAALLLSRNLLEEHARREPMFLDAIRQQKPFWDDVVSCRPWVKGYETI